MFFFVLMATAYQTKHVFRADSPSEAEKGPAARAAPHRNMIPFAPKAEIGAITPLWRESPPLHRSF